MKPTANHPVTVRWVLFGFKGRIGRKSFGLAALLMILVQAAVISQIIGTPEDDPMGALWALVLMASWLASAWAGIALAVKRLHDLGMPGILAICLLIPAISLIAFLFLAAMPPSQETNEHGPPPFPKK
ncbi:DUF805 domain-containing protein [Oricola cellulosilytica]|uniref:DUF805 domain-containing protein n=1 Tax=Oricola cellulosilytica TaxID=1429082 RepID=UPI001304F6DB|nr:DUF805 domain-containing protein [Oricola cellulosilytica]